MPVQCPWNRLWKRQVGQAATKSDGKSWCGAWKQNCFDAPKAWESPNCLVLSHTVYDFQPYLEMIASDSHYFQTREGWSLTDKLYSGYCNILRPPFGKHPFTMVSMRYSKNATCRPQISQRSWKSFANDLTWPCLWFGCNFWPGSNCLLLCVCLPSQCSAHCGNITLKDRMYLANVTWWFNIIWLVVWNIFYFPQ